jgi:hypothetical protein
MDADAILAEVRSGSVPVDWYVWNVRRDHVMRRALRWGAGGLFALVIFVFAAVQTIPDNFTHGPVGIIITSALLLMFGAAAFGSLGYAVVDLLRALKWDKYLLVITPDDYLQIEPRKRIHVPMSDVALVTVKGVTDSARPAESLLDRTSGIRAADRMAMLTTGQMYGREPKRAPSLAFLDTRTDKEVVVATDDSYDDLVSIERILSGYSLRKARS